MARLHFTDRVVRGLKGQPGEHRDTGCAGLSLRVTRDGLMSWTVRYRCRRQQRRETVGHYPETSLSRARARALEIRVTLDRGEDPGSEAAAAAGSMPVPAVLAEALDHARANRRRPEIVRIAIEHHLLPAWRRLRIGELTAQDVRDVLAPLLGRESFAYADQILVTIRSIVRHAISRGHLSEDPSAGVEVPHRQTRRDRHLSTDEIAVAWREMGTLDRPTADALRLVLLTGQRSGEVRAMRHDQISGDLWAIPPEAHKPGRGHTVPLSRQALGIIRQHGQPPGLVMVSQRIAGQPIGLVTMSRAAQRICRRTGMARWTPHDLRRTAATLMAQQGVRRHVIERVLGHADRSQTAVYDRYGYLPEMRDAVARLADAVEMATSAEPPSESDR